MSLPVNLRVVIDEMDTLNDQTTAYIHRRTGEVVSISEDEIIDDGENLPDWQAELAAKAKEVEESDDFVQLPDKFDIHEYAIMERFCHEIEADDIRHDLLHEIRGRGAFRRFKAMIRHKGIEDGWWGYRDAALKTIAADFLEVEAIPFTD